MQTKLSIFTQRRNWLIARIRGATSIFTHYSFNDFSPELQEEAGKIQSAMINLDRKLATTWKEQKAYFVNKGGLKNENT